MGLSDWLAPRSKTQECNYVQYATLALNYWVKCTQWKVFAGDDNRSDLAVTMAHQCASL
jgi:hypothetical protein